MRRDGKKGECLLAGAVDGRAVVDHVVVRCIQVSQVHSHNTNRWAALTVNESKAALAGDVADDLFGMVSACLDVVNVYKVEDVPSGDPPGRWNRTAQ